MSRSRKDQQASHASESTRRRIQLGSDIRRYRTAAGRTQQQVADALGWWQGAVHRVESGERPLSLPTLYRILDHLEVDGPERQRLVELAAKCLEDATRRSSGGGASAPKGFDQFSSQERAAQEIWSWQYGRLSGALQSEHYALLQFKHGAQVRNLQATLKRRMERQHMFAGRTLLSYRAVISEEVLMRMPGGWSDRVALDQIEHLLWLTEKYPRISLQLLPFDADLACPPTSFTMMRLPYEGADAQQVFIEHSSAVQRVRGNEAFQLFSDDWLRVVNAALSTYETRKRLVKRAKDLQEEIQKKQL